MTIKTKFYETKRQRFSADEKSEMLKQQENKCKDCQKDLVGVKCEIDHIRPLSNGGSNEKTNLQVLCVSCHLNKTREEHDTCEHIKIDEFVSCFNLQAYEVIKSKHFLKCAFTQNLVEPEKMTFLRHGDMYQGYCADFNKCRRNLLLHSKQNFCSYSVLDNIEPFDGNINDGFYYVECENVFPLRKNGFYSRPMIEYCLNKNIIGLENIKHQFKPSFTVEPTYFKEFASHLLQAFDFMEDDDKKNRLQKLAINSLVGLFGRRKNTYISKPQICDAKNPDEIASHYQRHKNPYINEINDDVCVITCEEEIKKLESYFPIHAQILDLEAIELHKLVSKIEGAWGVPCAVKTDAVIYYAHEPIDFSGEYWDEAKTIPKLKQDQNFTDVQRPIKIENTLKLEMEETVYTEYTREQIYADSDWSRIAQTIIQSEKGCLLLGPAGAGKTTLINKIISEINDDKSVKRLAPTNVSAMLINGETLDKFTYGFVNGGRTMKKYQNLKYIFVDEISMVKEIFYQVLMSIKLCVPNVKFIISGDFNQLPPVKDRVQEIYKKSRCLFELVDGRRLTLIECKRSDAVLFDICQSVVNDVPVDITRFRKVGDTYKNVSHTNKKRKAVNYNCMSRFLKEHPGLKTLNVEKLEYDDNSTSMTLCKGMPLIARINQKSLGVVNNEVFKIDDVKNDCIIVSNPLKDKVEIPLSKINRMFHLAFCITIHKSQGQTFDEAYTIHEYASLEWRLKYVALSRSSNIEHITIKLN